MNSFGRRVSAMALAAVCTLTPAVRVMAAKSDIIDTGRTATLTIHKYDLTAATEDGIDVTQFHADGERNAAAEQALERYVIEGVEFTYVKVGNIHTESDGEKVNLLYDIPPALENVLGMGDDRGDHKHTSGELSKALKAALAQNTTGKNALEKYVAGASGKAVMPPTDESGVTGATGLPLGLYLIVETKVPANVNTTVDPFLVSLPMTDAEGDEWFYDVNVYPKNQADIPDLDKLVRQNDDAALYQKPEYQDIATASEGDRMDYIFVSHLPEITSEATYLTQYTFVDQMDKGLTYNKDAAVYFYDNETDARTNNTEKAVKVWKHNAAQFAEAYEGGNSDYNQMTITPSRAGLKELNSGFSKHWLVVAYSVTVNSDATVVLGDAGNTNDVALTWKRTSMDFADILEDRARIYTFGVSLKKEFSDEKKPGDATKVQFILQNKTDGHYVKAKKSDTGVYYVTDSVKGATEKEGTVFSPAADGTMVINGLEADTYVMTEIHTSAGYSLLKKSMTIDIVCTEDEFTPSQTTLYDIQDILHNPHKKTIEINGDRAHAAVDGKTTNMSAMFVKSAQSANARVDMHVLNTPSFTLPNTGGYGTIFFTLAGCAAALAGIVLMTKKTKKEV